VETQKIMQRRRRLEQDRDLMLSLKKRSDDLTVLVHGHPSEDRLGQRTQTATGRCVATERHCGDSPWDRR
jgi:hypothetical protein